MAHHMPNGPHGMVRTRRLESGAMLRRTMMLVAVAALAGCALVTEAQALPGGHGGGFGGGHSLSGGHPGQAFGEGHAGSGFHQGHVGHLRDGFGYGPNYDYSATDYGCVPLRHLHTSRGWQWRRAQVC
jgi:hypothetical protein